MASTSKAKMYPLCDRSDHQRSTSKFLCDKVWLCNILYNDDIKTRNEAEVSKLTIEASLYVHYNYMKKLNKDLKNFPKTIKSNVLFDLYSHLQVDKFERKANLIEKDEEHFSQIRLANWPLYDSSYRTYLIQNAAVQHETAMKNCITVRLFNRIVRYFATRMWKEKIVMETDCLPKLVQEVCEHGQRVVVPSAVLVPVSVLVCQTRFAVFLVFKSGLKHVRYDGRGLGQLLKDCRIVEASEKNDEFMAYTPKYWWENFNLEHKRYEAGKSNDIIDECEKKEILNSDHYLGIDPGVVNYIGACLLNKEHIINPKGKKGKEINYFLKSATFKENPKWKEMIQDRKVDFNAKPSGNINATFKYIKYCMQFFEESQRKYSRRRVTYLKFDYYIRRRQAIDKLVNRLLPAAKNVRTFVCSGCTRLHASMVFGHKIPAAEKLRKNFKRRKDKCEIIEVDEYRTSKIRLPKDYNEDIENIKVIKNEPARSLEDNNENRNTPKRCGLHRYAICKTCHIIYNRDVNAGRNIIIVETQDVKHRKSTLQRQRVGIPDSDSGDSTGFAGLE
ncbi:hypothetical protein ABEB36_005938 [Hypothenemus hampei]|uniref:Transposase n=1 Tax=Hypothenemus hampei TaxID=57062 RepID=A0ABD1F3S1_HYPHA